MTHTEGNRIRGQCCIDIGGLPTRPDAAEHALEPTEDLVIVAEWVTQEVAPQVADRS